jgi:transcriptional regulator with XRE-family HTH domain/tetratricopeptide (TPR) repeat protein
MASDARKHRVPNRRLANERKKRHWTQSDLAGELFDLCDDEELEEHGTIDVNMVSKWERGLHTPRFFWQRKLCTLFGLDAQALGFIDKGETKDPGMPQEVPSLQNRGNVDPDESRPLHIILPPHSSHLVNVHVYHLATPLPGNATGEDGMLDTRRVHALRQEYLTEGGHAVNRREFTRKAIGIATAAFISPDDLFETDFLDRCFRALKKPSTIDERFLDYLEARTAQYWQERHGAMLASNDLLGFVIEHLQRVIDLLEETLLPSIRTRLCCIASGIAQLAGHLLFDMGKSAQARAFHHLAVTAAQEGGNQALEAVAWGRMSFTWTYSQQATEALRCIQEARRLATRSVNATVRAYLAAVEAEIQATLEQRAACLEALDAAEEFEDRQYSKEEVYWLHFDRSRLAGYQGICFRRLYHPDDARTQSFLSKAQQALTDALSLLEPTRIQRRPTLLIDLASTYAQQGDVDGASEHAMQSLSILAQTKSQTTVKRLLTLRQELEPWQDTQSIKNLDHQIAQHISMSG